MDTRLQEVKDYLKIIYDRSLAMDMIAELDGIQFDFVDDNKIRLLGFSHNFVSDKLVINNIFDELDGGCFKTLRQKVSTVIWDKEDGNMRGLTDIPYNYNLNVTKANDILCFSRYGASSFLKELELNSCDIIRSSAFEGITTLLKVDLGRTHTIERNAFANCIHLNKIDLSKVCYIGKNGFSNTSIVSADLREMECLETGAFQYCEDLEEITLSSKCQYISDGAFNYSKKLKTINFIGSQEEWRSLSKNIHNWRNSYGEYSREYSKNRIYVKYIKN